MLGYTEQKKNMQFNLKEARVEMRGVNPLASPIYSLNRRELITSRFHV